MLFHIFSGLGLEFSLTEVSPVFFWAVLFVVCLVIEGSTAALTTIWFAAGALVAFILTFFDIAFAWQIGAFIAVSLILLFLTRPIVKRVMYRNTESKTNKDRLIGRTAYVQEAICNIESRGYIKLDDVSWRAESIDDSVIDVGTLVKVVDIQGNRLIVSTIH